MFALLFSFSRLYQFIKICVRHIFFESYRCQYYVFRWGTWVPALQGVITFFVLANFTLATFMDPGVIPKGMFIHKIKESSNKLVIVVEKV